MIFDNDKDVITFLGLGHKSYKLFLILMGIDIIFLFSVNFIFLNRITCCELRWDG